jgi:hypothetical protein
MQFNLFLNVPMFWYWVINISNFIRVFAKVNTNLVPKYCKSFYYEFDNYTILTLDIYRYNDL